MIVAENISFEELKKAAERLFGDMVKAVVDIEKRIMAMGGELHADDEAALLEQGSRPQDLWGINIYPDKPREEWLEFDSVINIRPANGNRSRNVEDEKIRKTIERIVDELVEHHGST